jgi:hypothetical protein
VRSNDRILFRIKCKQKNSSSRFQIPDSCLLPKVLWQEASRRLLAAQTNGAAVPMFLEWNAPQCVEASTGEDLMRNYLKQHQVVQRLKANGEHLVSSCCSLYSKIIKEIDLGRELIKEGMLITEQPEEQFVSVKLFNDICVHLYVDGRVDKRSVNGKLAQNTERLEQSEFTVSFGRLLSRRNCLTVSIQALASLISYTIVPIPWKKGQSGLKHCKLLTNSKKPTKVRTRLAFLSANCRRSGASVSYVESVR